jgi:hypothetical protein
LIVKPPTLSVKADLAEIVIPEIESVTKVVLLCDTESEQDSLKVFHECIEDYFSEYEPQ